MLSGKFDWKAVPSTSDSETSQHKYKDLSSFGTNLHSAIGYNFGQTSTVLFDIEVYDSSMDEGEAELSTEKTNADGTIVDNTHIEAKIDKDDISSNQFAFAYSSTMKAAPEIHYSWYLGHAEQEQNFVFTDGEQIISSDDSRPVGAIDGLNSSYEAQWSGPWIGFEMWEKVGSHTILFRYQHYEVDFEATGNWNLQASHFEQEADGEGGTMRIEYQYSFSDYLSLGTVYNWNRWVAKKGTYTLFNADGSSDSALLDKVSWEYYTISINLLYKI